MKIEKISDTQIRCTLNKNDLADRHLRISELAYGTEKAKALFRDMMQQASTEFGFDADNIPLMIEAIPVSPDCLILVITKVEDPDELDTRFSNFTPDEEDEEDDSEDFMTPEERATADQILQCFEQLNDLLLRKAAADDSLKLPDFLLKKKNSSADEDAANNGESAKKLIYSFRFASLGEVTALAGVIAPFYRGENTLYKNPSDASYHLVLHMSEHRPADFNKICNIASEYGTQERFGAATASFFDEHMECIIRGHAVQMLEKLD